MDQRLSSKFKHYLNEVSSINDDVFEASIESFRELRLSKGEFLIKEGQVCHQVAFIGSGILRTFYLSGKAEYITSCFCTENSLTTSYKSLIQQSPSAISIQAITDVDVLVIEKNNLEKLYAAHPYWQLIGRSIAEKEYLILEAYASVLNTESAKEKYLRLQKEQPEVMLRANVEHIASYLGVTRRTLSRIRKELTTGPI